jgi:hypothetical protein
MFICSCHQKKLNKGKLDQFNSELDQTGQHDFWGSNSTTY